MLQELRNIKTVIIAAAAFIIAFVSAKFMAQGTPLVTIPWGIVALITGYLANTKREALVSGGLFAFMTSYAYLWFDNTSGKSLLMAAVVLIPAFFGLICGISVSWLGWIASRSKGKSNTK